jgi:hypothetical protein
MSTFLGIVITAVSVFTFAVVAWVFAGQPRRMVRKDVLSKDDSAVADAPG